MAPPAETESSGCIAVVRVDDTPAGAQLVWAEAGFYARFERAGAGAPAFAAGLPDALAEAFRSLTPGADSSVECAGLALFGHRIEAALGVAALGGGLFALSVPLAGEDASDDDDARLAEILDAVPVAVAVVAATDGTILWMNGPFRDLLGGSEFDLMGTPLANHFALPGAFKTLMGATGPVAPSSALPTAMKTLSGTMAPVVANAKRLVFRGQPDAMVTLTSGL
jgi:PAS domain-containing protein